MLFHSTRRGSTPLSRAKAVTENMLHDAVDTASLARLASYACIGPLDSGTMRAAMRWHSSLVRADQPCPALLSFAFVINDRWHSCERLYS